MLEASLSKPSLSNTYRKAEEAEEHLLTNTSVGIAPPVVLQVSQLRCEHFCSEMKSTSWHSVNKRRKPHHKHKIGFKNACSVETL